MAESMIFTLEMFEDAREYWEEKLSGDLAELNLAADFPGYGNTGKTGAGVHKMSLGTAVSETLFRISKNNDLALFVILTAAFKVLLFKFTGQADIIITSPTLKQSQQNYNKFVAFRDYPLPGMTFKEFLMNTRKTVVEGYKYQFYPIRKLIKFLQIENTALLFKVMMLLDTIHHRDALEEVGAGFKNDILVSFSKDNGNLVGEVVYNSGLYKPGTIRRLMDLYRELLTFVSNNMDSDISGIEIFSEGEKKRILYDFNDTAREFPRDKTLQQLFAHQVEKTPDLEAVVDIGSGEPDPPAVTYRQLDEKSHRLAQVLKSKGVKPETLVAILVEPSIEVITGMIGILKAGCVYMPIDPDYPPVRIDYILKDSRAKIVLTGPGTRLENIGEERLIEILDISDCLSETVSTVVSGCRVDSASLAYVLYTSGTTGTPKGVMVTHRNAARLVKNPNYIVLEQGQRLLLTGVMTFDITTFEIWAPLLNGLSLFLANENTILDPERLGEVLAANRISILHLVPQLFNQIAAANMEIFGGLKYLLVGGDLVKPQYINRLRNKYKHLNILHMYGPTENTTFTTCFPIKQGYKTGIPIGKPVSNTVVYILDHYGQLLPVGAVGELCTGGEGVGRGYLNNPGLTLERFKNYKLQNTKYKQIPKYKSQITNQTVPGSIGEHLNQKLLQGVQGGGFLEKNPPGRRRQNVYKTGDLARWLEDGNIEFLGRVDQQVKVRGIRIEPGEIEAILLKLPRVKEVAVTIREIPVRGNKGAGNEDTEKSLCAYLVTDEEPDIAGLKNHLSGYLPAYMLPQYFIRVSAMPLTPNGKLDHRALPEPRITVEEQYVPPANELEEKLIEIWAQVLGIEKGIIGVFTSFFDLGGHSLRATILSTKIHKELEVKLPLTEIFKTPTVREQAGYIKKAARDRHASLEPVEKRDYYALSSAQKRLYILQQIGLESTAYNIPGVITLDKKPDIKKLQQTFRILIKRHESFRTSFEMREGEPVQRIRDRVEFEIEEYDTVGKNQSAADFINSFIRPFDLAQAPLIRVGLFKRNKTGAKYILLLDMHHIITDGISQRILTEEFMRVEAHGEEGLPGIRIQYKDFSQWRKVLFVNEPGIKKQEDFWVNDFSGDIPVLNLAYDFARPVPREFAGSIVNFGFSREQSRQLNRLAASGDVTLFMLLLALFNVLLAKISSQEDIVVGTGVAGRRHADLQEVVGIFVNTLAIKNYPVPEKPFKTFLKEVKQKTLKAFENQEYPFENLVDKVVKSRDTSRNPLFDVMLILQNQEPDRTPNPNSTSPESSSSSPMSPQQDNELFELQHRVSKFDMTLFGIEVDDVLNFSLEYSTTLFKRETIDILITYFKEIATAAVSNPGKSIKEIAAMPEQKKLAFLRQLNHQWQQEVEAGTGQFYTLQECLNAGFNRFGPAAAIEYNNIILTYDQLHRETHLIAHDLLNNQGIPRGSFVGVLMNSRLNLILTMIGVFKAGCVFIPLDPEYPQARLAWMIENTGIEFIVHDHANTGLAEEEGFNHLEVHWLPGHEGGDDKEQADRISLPLIVHQPEDMIYVYFTSGSTGKPKAIPGKNRSLLHFIQWEINTFEVDRTFRVSQLIYPGFDAFLRDVLVPLCAGGRVIIPPGKDTLLEPGRLLNWLQRSGVHLIHCVPGLFRTMNPYIHRLTGNSLTSLKYVLFSGEKVDASDLVEWFDRVGERIKFVNLYGPTETTLIRTYHIIGTEDLQRERIPVGRPIQGTQVLILDQDINLCDQLVSGEIYIRTPYMTGGYFNDPGLTREKFLQNPFNSEPGDLIYKTGDLGRISIDGTIDLLGRNDRQVKIRGMRVEPEEIERVLMRHPLVLEAAVVKKQISIGNELLYGYITGKKTSNSDSNGPGTPADEGLIPELTRYLACNLPSYMVPARLIEIETMPRKPNGKIDYTFLPDPVPEDLKGIRQPRSDIEKKIMEFWISILGKGIAGAGVTRSFFELGGNSLNIMTLTLMIHREFNVRILPGQIFSNPTIENQAALIQNMKVSHQTEQFKSLEVAEKKEYYPLTYPQRRFYNIQQMDLSSTMFNTIEIIKLEGPLFRDKIEGIFRQLILRHESLRTSFFTLDEQPLQQVHDQVQFSILEAAAPSDEKSGAEPMETVIKKFLHPFDLARAPLLRVGVSCLEEQKHLLMVDMHHIISDGLSKRILVQDFMSLYRGRQLLALRLQYKDYAEWQKKQETIGVLARQEQYWLKQFEKEVPALNLPTDYPRPRLQRFEGKIIHFHIAERETMELTKLVHEEQVTLNILLLAIFYILLAKISGSHDIVVGCASAGREHVELQKVIGVFINVLVLRNCPDPEKSARDFLKDVKASVLNALDNQDYPYDELLQRVPVKRDPSRHPLYEAVFHFIESSERQEQQEEPPYGPSVPTDNPLKTNSTGSPVQFLDYDKGFAQTDLIFHGNETPKGIDFLVEYSVSLFKEETIYSFINYYKNLVQAIPMNPDRKIADIDIVSAQEKQRVLSQIQKRNKEINIEFNL